MPDIRFSCHKCGQHLEAEPTLQGDTIQCPSCRISIRVPSVKHRKKVTPPQAHPTGAGSESRRPAKKTARKRCVLALTAGLIIGYIFGAGFPVGERGSVLPDSARALSAQRLTKDEWKAKAYAYFRSSGEYEGQGHMVTPTLLWGIDGEVFKRVMGNPDRTQTIGGNMYWYYTCRDGMIQLVLENREGVDNLLVGDINDY